MQNLLQREKAALIVIDMQEAFRKVIPDFYELTAKISTMIRACRILQVPVIVTEQYPKGLKHTVEEILSVLPADQKIYEKSSFSSCGAEGFMEHLESLNASQAIICGIETHVCVNQTAHELLEKGFQVHLLADCVSSRFEINKQIGIEKMKQSGAVLSSLEMAIFELMRSSAHPCFKEIQSLIK
ncbi:MAG: hydrolase [Acidobacteria bacterium]|jgi:nicotinamidase-related amidase|nr:MAG: hydrolase [Acidobacteriota bacterium]GIU81543.1 MAG: hydrolase [Pyrinomonadaceae bacterium]